MVLCLRSKANAKGAFSWAPELTRLGRLQWQARVLRATVGSTTFKPSVSAAKNSSFADRTYVTHFVAMHLHGATSLGAIIQDYPQSGGVHYANVSGTAKFYYLPTGTKTWRYLGASKATSGNGGSVAVEPSGTLSGKFKIVLRRPGELPRLDRDADPEVSASPAVRLPPAAWSAASGRSPRPRGAVVHRGHSSRRASAR